MAFPAVRTMPCCIALLIQTTSATVERDAFYGPADAAYPGGHEPRSQRLHDEGAAGSGNGRDELDRWHEDVGILSQSNFSDVLRRFALTSRGELLSFATDGPMSGTLPTELGQLAGIRHIMLGGHLISGTLPTELARLTSLESIDLSSNALSGTLPSEMARLSRLRFLSVHNNLLSGSLPTQWGAGLGSMRTIDLSGNRFSFSGGSLPAAIAGLGIAIALLLVVVGCVAVAWRRERRLQQHADTLRVSRDRANLDLLILTHKVEASQHGGFAFRDASPASQRAGGAVAVARRAIYGLPPASSPPPSNPPGPPSSGVPGSDTDSDAASDAPSPTRNASPPNRNASPERAVCAAGLMTREAKMWTGVSAAASASTSSSATNGIHASTFAAEATLLAAAAAASSPVTTATDSPTPGDDDGRGSPPILGLQAMELADRDALAMPPPPARPPKARRHNSSDL